jgi:hypothetical protein
MNPLITAAVADERRDDLLRTAAVLRRAQLVDRTSNAHRLSVRRWFARGYL